MQQKPMRQARRLTKLFVLSSLLFAGFYQSAAVAAPVCQTGTLANYISLDSDGGCTIGNFDFLRFSDPTPTTTGSPTVASASQITLTPIQTTNGAGFSISAMLNGTNLFAISSPSGTTSVTYFVDYSVDPAPVITGGDLKIDPPYGNVSASQVYCTADVLLNGCLLGTLSHQSVDAASPISVISFVKPSSFVDIATDISLVATPGNPAGLDAVNALVDTPLVTTTIPEPSVLLLTICPLLFLFVMRRKRA